MTRRKKNLSKAVTRRQKIWGWIKLISFLIFLGFVALFGGFLEFSRNVSQQTTPINVLKADGIAVWTGPGGGRLETGTQLLKSGKGERLLISGVNTQNSRDDIVAVMELTEAEQSCCLDLDYAAVDTVGNAKETASWANALGYEHIILVTSDYHMPRAQIEITARAGRIRITPYPVISDRAGPWWKDRTQFDRLLQEYGKLLRTLLRKPRNNSIVQTMPEILLENPPIKETQ